MNKENSTKRGIAFVYSFKGLPEQAIQRKVFSKETLAKLGIKKIISDDFSFCYLIFFDSKK